MDQKDKNLISTLWKFRGFKIFVFSLSAILILGLSGFLILTKGLSTNSINYPQVDHLHFRMQVVYHGEYVNLADSKFQQVYEKGQCTGALTENPIHLHDGKDQIIHIHWKDITGGQVLKYYGLNKIGGIDDILGFRLDSFSQLPPQIKAVKTHGNLLPKPEKNDIIYVYTGDTDNYQKRTESDLLNQNLETFFGQKSQLNQSFLSLPAFAHGGEPHAHADSLKPSVPASSDSTNITNTSADTTQPTEEELKEINNLIGNVVIFIQKDEPTETQIKDRFNHLEPLSPSTCGG